MAIAKKLWLIRPYIHQYLRQVGKFYGVYAAIEPDLSSARGPSRPLKMEPGRLTHVYTSVMLDNKHGYRQMTSQEEDLNN